ncbi:hypothetical protein G6F24_016851 [Rhizopus arrhizus]|nr:hypothetical protein G6F24_016851 [Rhizopus arrhizus]
MADALGLAGGMPGLLRQLHDRLAQVLQQQVFGEGVLRRNRLHLLVRFHRPLVHTACAVVQAAAEAAERLFQINQRPLPQVATGDAAARGQLAFHHLAHAGHPVHRQRQQERIHTLRWNHELAVGLAPVRSDLGQELVRCDSG